ncbi:MAG TPA: alpha/beta family hydrolase [Acidimicrobiales bacterium]|nr:alpha/beta family hydrolase [Acidimicrobiales bacterium]
MARFGLLLAPGAGAGSDQPGLVAIDEAVTAIGGVVRRMDFPYRLEGRRAPDKPPKLIRSVLEEAAALSRQTGLTPQRIYLGGRSMGGRMCSMAVAQGLQCAGLVLVSYPLHPPGKPASLRTAHFGSLTLPCLFVSGARDAFASPDELRLALAGVPGPVTTVFVQGGDHGLRRKEQDVAAIVAGWLTERVH